VREFTDQKNERQIDLIISLLRDIKEQREPINTIEKLKANLSPREFEEAIDAKLSSVSLGEVVEVCAQAAGFADSKEWFEHLQRTKNRRELEKINTRSIFEVVQGK
jgi:hypothetical protein